MGEIAIIFGAVNMILLVCCVILIRGNARMELELRNANDRVWKLEDDLKILQFNEGRRPLALGMYKDWFIVKAATAAANPQKRGEVSLGKPKFSGAQLRVMNDKYNAQVAREQEPKSVSEILKEQENG